LAREEVKREMQNQTIHLNTATYVGIDAHPTEHTALAINRFEEKKGQLRFPNTLDGISQFLSWLKTIEKQPAQTIIGIEGRGTSGNAMGAFGDSYTPGEPSIIGKNSLPPIGKGSPWDKLRLSR
jgi:hypothetical protein